MVQIGFYFLPLVMTSSVLLMSYLAPGVSSLAKKKTSYTFLAGVLVWVIYLSLLSRYGMLDDFGFPPRVPILIIIPAMVCIFLFVTRSYTKQVVHSTPKAVPVYVQSFRVVVELLIYGAYLQGTFPEAVTFEGTNFDILVGISAPFIAFLYQKNKISIKGLLVWNICSLSVLALTAYSFIAAFYIHGVATWSNRDEFVQLPYLLLAGMLLPFAIFYHVISIRQTSADKK